MYIIVETHYNSNGEKVFYCTFIKMYVSSSRNNLAVKVKPYLCVFLIFLCVLLVFLRYSTSENPPTGFNKNRWNRLSVYYFQTEIFKSFQERNNIIYSMIEVLI